MERFRNFQDGGTKCGLPCYGPRLKRSGIRGLGGIYFKTSGIFRWTWLKSDKKKEKTRRKNDRSFCLSKDSFAPYIHFFASLFAFFFFFFLERASFFSCSYNGDRPNVHVMADVWLYIWTKRGYAFFCFLSFVNNARGFFFRVRSRQAAFSKSSNFRLLSSFFFSSHNFSDITPFFLLIDLYARRSLPCLNPASYAMPDFPPFFSFFFSLSFLFLFCSHSPSFSILLCAKAEISTDLFSTRVSPRPGALYLFWLESNFEFREVPRAYLEWFNDSYEIVSFFSFLLFPLLKGSLDSNDFYDFIFGEPAGPEVRRCVFAQKGTSTKLNRYH